MSLIKFFDEMEEPRVLELGGKGYSLAMLMNHGFNVPRGFVITSGCSLSFWRRII